MIMADVSGKGVPAALIMVAIRTVLKSFDEKEVLDPQHVLSVMNSALSVEETEKYATMYYCVFDSGTGRMVYANGGHGPLLLFRASLGQFEDLDTPGMPVGVLPDTTFGSGETRLQRGDIGVIYTDGITEAMTAAREEYSLQRVREVVRANANRSAQEIADTILAEIKEFVGDAPQHDDETLIVIKYI
jgi:sigma-B regulation protein RsbU (phosphoserine phosphatase)